jgi:hypothetical protein
MHNILLNVSAVALQKKMEKEANAANREDFSNLDVPVEEVKPSTSILLLLANWLGDKKAAQPRVVPPKLKNKIV